MKTEPAILVAFVAAVIALAVSFGFDLTADQTKAIMGLTVIVAGLVTRQKVTPV